MQEHVQPHDSFGTQNMQAVSEIHQQDRDVGLTVQSVSELPLSGCLMVDPFTLRSLQIFVNEQHPSNMGIGKPKEGFSLYGMLHAQCMSNMGKHLLRSWMLCPVVNLASVADRQNAVQLLMNSPDKALILKNVVKKIQDIPRVLQRLSDAQVHPDVQSLQTVVFSLQQLQNLRDIFQQLTSAAPSSMDMTPLQVRYGIFPLGDLQWSDVSISHKILTQISSALRQCEEIICDIIDFPQEEGFMIKYGVCEELDKLKDMYHSLPDTLTMVLQEELHRIPQHLAQRNSSQLWSIVYLPQIGYVMQISGAALTDDLADILKDYEHVMEGQADDGAPSVYFHTQSTRDLSASVGDVLYKIQDLEATLCTELIKRLLLYTPQLLSAASAVAELDCLLAFASCARDGSYCRPKLVPESVLVIDEGRHPLAELVVDTYIPNSTCMDDEGGNRVHIITGPNASGKSCYIKQVAMIAYMAHLGCFVPAKSATIGLIDRIFTRLIAGMIYRATERSLIIVDEFGKGTLPCDGAGLLSAFVQHICDAPRRPPRALFSTHFQELLDPQVLPKYYSHKHTS
ncbi:hypothetical protein CEUSTIGMA_g9489.t1 [Chlamydomonas eustigma]|uniref:DNA mismatch repair proteins mutS family domain-containing protein n=1 Tax=Chlamydomonas eustigma TaxID=1157962 RepID=A0A250XG60_9CHLO|nr:hypothetical protein CEUSTIGMA_g9489.t1 [Chlamydomonas eustigma]|eukprot:GAX82061.1 hypothetical protein CEUSTIGMA_g9489.t1 [Chlamydomonas eustigma]